MKKYYIILLSIFLLTGCNNENDDYGTTYKIELNNEPYNVCGNKVYFSNNVDGNELNIEEIIEEIEEICEVSKIDEAKKEIENILYDEDRTNEDIRKDLNDIYSILDK